MASLVKADRKCDREITKQKSHSQGVEGEEGGFSGCGGDGPGEMGNLLPGVYLGGIYESETSVDEVSTRELLPVGHVRETLGTNVCGAGVDHLIILLFLVDLVNLLFSTRSSAKLILASPREFADCRSAGWTSEYEVYRRQFCFQRAVWWQEGRLCVQATHLLMSYVADTLHVPYWMILALALRSA
eukprot:6283996-Amphidinium_carterae.3